MTRRERERIIVGVLIAIVGLFWLLNYNIDKKIDVNKATIKSSEDKLVDIETSRKAIDDLIAKNELILKDLTSQITESKKSLNSLSISNASVSDIIANPENARYAYLTFDDGPSSNTIKVLDFLKINNIKATFFVLGTGDTSIYKRIVEDGHTIALHSDTHKYEEIYKDVDSYMADLNALSDKIKATTGVEPKILRFPGGSVNGVSKKHGGEDIMDRIRKEVLDAGYVYFDWNVDSQDAAKNNQDPNIIVESVMADVSKYKQSVILMHDAGTKGTTVEALPEIVRQLRSEGFLIKPLTVDTPPVRFK